MLKLRLKVSDALRNYRKNQAIDALISKDFERFFESDTFEIAMTDIIDSRNRLREHFANKAKVVNCNEYIN